MRAKIGGTLVAQVGNLLYRRLAVGLRSDRLEASGLPIRDTADCQSALRFKAIRQAWAFTDYFLEIQRPAGL